MSFTVRVWAMRQLQPIYPFPLTLPFRPFAFAAKGGGPGGLKRRVGVIRKSASQKSVQKLLATFSFQSHSKTKQNKTGALVLLNIKRQN